jgi:hypothetical protein
MAGVRLGASVLRIIEERLRFGQSAGVWYRVAARMMRTLGGGETSDGMRQPNPAVPRGSEAVQDYVDRVFFSARIYEDEQCMAAIVTVG